MNAPVYPSFVQVGETFVFQGFNVGGGRFVDESFKFDSKGRFVGFHCCKSLFLLWFAFAFNACTINDLQHIATGKTFYFAIIAII